jgi:hypothetical protein
LRLQIALCRTVACLIGGFGSCLSILHVFGSPSQKALTLLVTCNLLLEVTFVRPRIQFLDDPVRELTLRIFCERSILKIGTDAYQLRRVRICGTHPRYYSWVVPE